MHNDHTNLIRDALGMTTDQVYQWRLLLLSGQNGAIFSVILIKIAPELKIKDVLGITVRRGFLFWREVGRDFTENVAILEQTLSVSTLRCNQNCAFSRIKPNQHHRILPNLAQN